MFLVLLKLPEVPKEKPASRPEKDIEDEHDETAERTAFHFLFALLLVAKCVEVGEGFAVPFGNPLFVFRVRVVRVGHVSVSVFGFPPGNRRAFARRPPDKVSG